MTISEQNDVVCTASYQADIAQGRSSIDTQRFKNKVGLKIDQVGGDIQVHRRIRGGDRQNRPGGWGIVERVDGNLYLGDVASGGGCRIITDAIGETIEAVGVGVRSVGDEQPVNRINARAAKFRQSDIRYGERTDRAKIRIIVQYHYIDRCFRGGDIFIDGDQIIDSIRIVGGIVIDEDTDCTHRTAIQSADGVTYSIGKAVLPNGRGCIGDQPIIGRLVQNSIQRIGENGDGINIKLAFHVLIID